MSVHELVELGVGVLAPRVGGEQFVEVGEHVAYPLHGLGVAALQHLLHARELRVEHLAAQHLLDLLESRAGLRRAPVVVRQLADGARGVGRQRVERHLCEACVV